MKCNRDFKSYPFSLLLLIASSVLILVSCFLPFTSLLYADEVLIEGEARTDLFPGPDQTTLRDQARYVQKVIDGDTIVVRWHTLVRLIGVDAPEVDGPYRREEYYGKEAKEYLSHLIGGQKVLLKVDPENIRSNHKDKYGRLLAYVYLMDGTLVNAKLIEEGYGCAIYHFPYQLKDEFLQLEEKSKLAKKGIWAAPRDEIFGE